MKVHKIVEKKKKKLHACLQLLSIWDIENLNIESVGEIETCRDNENKE